jgi:peroxiredoxin
MQAEHGGDDFTVLGVTRGNVSEARAFASELGATYPILADAPDVFGEWGVRWIPQAYLIDPQGRVVARDLERIEELLRENL